MKKPTVLCVVSLHHGNGGKYIATNIAYALKCYAGKSENSKIVLVDANRYDSTLAQNLEIRNENTNSQVENRLTTCLKFDITKFRLRDENSIEEFKQIINGNSDFIIISTEIENFGFVDNLCKQKTNLLVIKPNIANNSKIENNIKMIKEKFKYVIVNCSEKTVKVSPVLKQNNIKVICRTLYNEYTIDNVNIKKATKIKKIKSLSNFKRLALIKIRKKAMNEISTS